MTLEAGSIVDGAVTGIAKFGAFVGLGDGQVGLVHISEIADAYVTDISQFLKVGDPVKVKVLGINKQGKYDLSIKQVEGAKKEPSQSPVPEGQVRERRPSFQHHDRKKREERRPETFEDKVTQFLKQSEEKLSDLKRNIQFKQEGRKKKKI